MINKIISVSGIQFYHTSSVYCIVYVPPQVKFPSITIGRFSEDGLVTLIQLVDLRLGYGLGKTQSTGHLLSTASLFWTWDRVWWVFSSSASMAGNFALLFMGF